jgi:hypothetical protein
MMFGLYMGVRNSLAKCEQMVRSAYSMVILQGVPIIAPELARLLVIHIFSKHRVPSYITCDQGFKFVSHFF